MRRHWIFVLFLLGAAVCVSIAPRLDSPDTTFNEADAPVNLAPPVRVRVHVESSAVDGVGFLPAPVQCTACTPNVLTVESSKLSADPHRRSLQSLLCTLLL